MSGEPYELRARKLYREKEQVKLSPGDSATVNRRQLRFMQDDVAKARAEGRMTVADAGAELAVLRQVRDQMDATARPVGIILSPPDREFSVRKKATPDKRRQHRAARQARATGRSPKKKRKR